VTAPASPAHPTPGGAAPPAEESKMTIWEHLEELRRRVIKAAIGVLGTTIIAWNFRERLLAELVKPYQRTWLEHFHRPLVL
jgi:sec-independent protein translocase protein TatC